MSCFIDTLQCFTIACVVIVQIGRLSRIHKDYLLTYSVVALFQSEDNAKRAKLDSLSDIMVSYMTLKCRLIPKLFIGTKLYELL